MLELVASRAHREMWGGGVFSFTNRWNYLQGLWYIKASFKNCTYCNDLIQDETKQTNKNTAKQNKKQ